MPKPLWKRQANREHDTRRRAEKPWRGLYNTARWKALRAQQLAAHPLCERCSTDERPVVATVAHHKIRHQGNEALFFGAPLGSLCAPCHDIDEQRIEKGGKARQIIADDGWPLV
jgi:5-methylcytosine-specific restriction protein A